PQQRVLDVAMRYWRQIEPDEPRDITRLRFLLGDGLDELRNWDQLSQAEATALSGRSAAVASLKLSRVLSEAQSFYTAAMGKPTDIYDMIGRPTERTGRLVVIDLQGLSDTAKQVVAALISSEILKAAASKTSPIRPSFLVYEEGHNFAPAGEPAISHRIIKKIASEGRKFGVGFAIISQRPSKLDPDVTSQCNTLITMRLKNPDDQRFITKASDMISKADIDELPSLSTGEALVCGRSIPAPLLVRIGRKALMHGGESPDVLSIWGRHSG
ncbi:MAG: ATP-binding protein, partial [bacterium]